MDPAAAQQGPGESAASMQALLTEERAGLG